jgi:hypothetical protein
MSPRRPFPLTATIPALACALVLLAGTPAWASDSPAEFKGKIGKTLADSEEYWPPPVTPPEGRPTSSSGSSTTWATGTPAPSAGSPPCPPSSAGADAGWYGRESKTLTCREARKENLNNA